MKNDSRSQLFTGEEHTFTLPSGKVITIRESNGEDDGILSRMKSGSEGAHVYNYLASIIIEDHSTKTKPVASDIQEWLVNDKYYLLFKQRIVNLGQELIIAHTCENETCKKRNEYTEDLSEMDGDLSQKDYKPNEKQIPKYIGGDSKTIEFTSSRKTRFQFELLTGALEQKDLDTPDDARDINNPLLSRNVKIFEQGKWLQIFDFRRFPSKEMNEVRNFILKNDRTFNPVVSFTCPKCRTPYQATLFNMPVFFFPGVEI